MLPLIFDPCVPRDEILSGGLSLDLFAAKLRRVVEGTAPQVYQDAHKFFANTFATDGIKTLIREVFSRLMKQSAGAGVVRLETSFGGGKTHDEIALWHICKQGREIHGLERFTDITVIPDPSCSDRRSRFRPRTRSLSLGQRLDNLYYVGRNCLPNWRDFRLSVTARQR